MVPPVVPSLQQPDIKTSELLRLWSDLDEAARDDLLAIACGLKSRQGHDDSLLDSER